MVPAKAAGLGTRRVEAARWFGGVNPAAESSPDLKCSGGEVSGCSGQRGKRGKGTRGAEWGQGGSQEAGWRATAVRPSRWAGKPAAAAACRAPACREVEERWEGPI